MTQSTWRAFGAALLAICLLGTVGSVSYAAGSKVVALGTANKSSKATTLQTKKGPALVLKTKKSSPPLKVNSKKRVAKLNADQVDGLDAEQLAPATTTYTFGEAGDRGNADTFLVENSGTGTYRMDVNASLVPAGPASKIGFCGLGVFEAGEHRYVAGSSAPMDEAVGWRANVSASKIVTLAPGERLSVSCLVDQGTFSYYDAYPLTVSLTPVLEESFATLTEFD